MINYKELKGCVGKSKHNTISDARRQLNKCKSKGKGNLNIYLCEYCGSYHIGHTNKH